MKLNCKCLLAIYRGSTYLIPCKILNFISLQVAEFPVLWMLYNQKLDACRAVEGMWDVYNFFINHSVETFLHCKVGDVERDEPGQDVHGDLQVLHGGKTITDIHCKGIIALKEMGRSIRDWGCFVWFYFHCVYNSKQAATSYLLQQNKSNDGKPQLMMTHTERAPD